MAQHAEIETLRDRVNEMEERLSKMVSDGDKFSTGNRSAFDALLRRAVLGEASRPEDGTSDPASS